MKYVKSKVVILPTEKRSLILKNIHGYPLFVSYGSKINNSRCKWQHLYILSNEVSNEEIKVGDWCIVNQVNDIEGNPLYELGRLSKIGKGGIHYFNELSICFGEHELDKVRKVITTTDKSLGLPRPSNEFLKKYCELGGIDEVLVGYESFIYNPLTEKEYSYQDNVSYEDCEKKYKLKVSSDNTITIRPIKDSWNREEVENLIEKAIKDLFGNDADIEDWDFDNWIEKNL